MNGGHWVFYKLKVKTADINLVSTTRITTAYLWVCLIWFLHFEPIVDVNISNQRWRR